MIAVVATLQLVLAFNCGYATCDDGMSCCIAAEEEVGKCYNKSIETCAKCGYGYVSTLCEPEKPHCCSDGRSAGTCYGGTDHCCETQGSIVPNTTFCIGACGTTTDPFEKCCKSGLTYDNRTHCCAGSDEYGHKLLCDTAEERCTECGCVALGDTTTHCCQAEKYDNTTTQCCPKVNNKQELCAASDTCSQCGCMQRPDIEECCMQHMYIPSMGETCCNHTNNPSKVCNSTQTCMIWKNPLPDGVCCNPGWEICQGHCYNPEVEQCCGEHPGGICDKNATCCGHKCC